VTFVFIDGWCGDPERDLWLENDIAYQCLMTEARVVSESIQTAANRAAYGQRVPASNSTRGDAFGALIREGRQRKGWTQDRLVDESGVSRATITRWEAGDARRPDPEQVRAVCLALDIDPRRAAVALGYLSPDEAAPVVRDGTPLSAEETEILDILRNPEIPSRRKAALVELLRSLAEQRQQPRKTG
jgi:transcriptional regulator with XRE-family HTH domain